jgi:Protein of unknown function (DUF4232)
VIRTSLLAAATLVAGSACLLAVPDAASAATACGNSSLTVTATAEQGATGHANFVLLFKNRTAASCSLYGYPGLDALRSTGSVLAHAKRTLHGFTGGSTHGLQTIVVAPGHYASADVEWMNFNPSTGGTCAFSHSVAATPANTSHTVQLARSVSACSLQVHPTVAGTSGNS